MVALLTLVSCGSGESNKQVFPIQNGHETGSGSPNEYGLSVLALQTVLNSAHDGEVLMELYRKCGGVGLLPITSMQLKGDSVRLKIAQSHQVDVRVEHFSTESEGGAYRIKEMRTTCRNSPGSN